MDLRFMVVGSQITDEELKEFESLIPIKNYMDNEEYEYNGNFILTKDLTLLNKHLENLCCGIISHNVILQSGETLYFAFDYGH
jgi:hypothetical protein